jgi:large-conductance mechanosensitive channel
MVKAKTSKDVENLDQEALRGSFDNFERGIELLAEIRDLLQSRLLQITNDREIENMIQNVSLAAVYQVIPNAAEDVFKKRDEARRLIAASWDVKKINYGNMLLAEIRDLLQSHWSQMAAYDKSQRRNGWTYALVGALVSAVIGYLLLKLLA